ncbi:Receptor-interacting serine/threonine-protein kinase 1 [Mortierella polycephala]|uniref:Receptor-interacting serine/threonine-protein kinase 1 n=1 Tax=Mortierella polycephala TaxID=41804 RepID=A0A9P6Q300_9FUNG|nr:Receptor-interacting serine/threonine-protein kinase 1 [Mortierella polycephala]
MPSSIDSSTPLDIRSTMMTDANQASTVPQIQPGVKNATQAIAPTTASTDSTSFKIRVPRDLPNIPDAFRKPDSTRSQPSTSPGRQSPRPPINARTLSDGSDTRQQQPQQTISVEPEQADATKRTHGEMLSENAGQTRYYSIFEARPAAEKKMKSATMGSGHSNLTKARGKALGTQAKITTPRSPLNSNLMPVTTPMSAGAQPSTSTASYSAGKKAVRQEVLEVPLTHSPTAKRQRGKSKSKSNSPAPTPVRFPTPTSLGGGIGGDVEEASQRSQSVTTESMPISSAVTVEFSETGPLELVRAGTTILDRLLSNPVCMSFVNKVSHSVTNYHAVIKKPMDLTTIERKLWQSLEKTDNNEGSPSTPSTPALVDSTNHINPSEGYSNLDDFEQDLRRIYQNATYFNPPGHAIYKQAQAYKVLYTGLLLAYREHRLVPNPEMPQELYSPSMISISEPSPLYLFRAQLIREMDRKMTDVSVDLFSTLHQPLFETMYEPKDMSPENPRFVRMYINKNRSFLSNCRDERLAKVVILSDLQSGKPFFEAPRYLPGGTTKTGGGTRMVRIKGRAMIGKPIGERHDMITVGDLDCPSAWIMVACVRAFNFEADIPYKFEKGTLSKMRHEVVPFDVKSKMSPEHQCAFADALGVKLPSLKMFAKDPRSPPSVNQDLGASPASQSSPLLVSTSGLATVASASPSPSSSSPLLSSAQAGERKLTPSLTFGTGVEDQGQQHVNAPLTRHASQPGLLRQAQRQRIPGTIQQPEPTMSIEPYSATEQEMEHDLQEPKSQSTPELRPKLEPGLDMDMDMNLGSISKQKQSLESEPMLESEPTAEPNLERRSKAEPEPKGNEAVPTGSYATKDTVVDGEERPGLGVEVRQGEEGGTGVRIEPMVEIEDMERDGRYLVRMKVPKYWSGANLFVTSAFTENPHSPVPKASTTTNVLSAPPSTSFMDNIASLSASMTASSEADDSNTVPEDILPVETLATPMEVDTASAISSTSPESLRTLTKREQQMLRDLKAEARTRNVPYVSWIEIEPTLTVDSAHGLFKRIYHVQGDDGLVVQNFKEMDSESFEQRVCEVACLLKLRGLDGVGQIQSVIDDERDHLVGLSMTKYAYTLKAYATNTRRHPSPCQKLSLVRDMVSAICSIHGAGLAHRDLSEVNIMVDEDPVQRLSDNTPRPWVRVIDFGKSVFVEPEEVKRWSMQEKVSEEELALLPLVVLPPDHGYKLYRSILTLPRSKHDHNPLPPVDPRSEDVYSLGVLIWRTFSGKSPWNGAIEDDIRTIRYLVSSDEQIQFQLEREVAGKKSRELLLKCLTAEASTRWTADQVREWLEQPEVLAELLKEFQALGGGRKRTRKNLD